MRIDRRIIRTQEAIKKAFLELMNEKTFDGISIQDIADRANINRSTVYLHYLDKHDLLDKLMEEHMNNLSAFCDLEPEMEFIECAIPFMKYFESNYLFFSTMLKSEGVSYFHNRFLKFSIEEFQKEVEIHEGEKYSQNDELIVQFAASAYVGIIEWWIKEGMPHPPHIMAEKVGELLEKVLLSGNIH